jgi:hypothetical protein
MKRFNLFSREGTCVTMKAEPYQMRKTNGTGMLGQLMEE